MTSFISSTRDQEEHSVSAARRSRSRRGCQTCRDKKVKCDEEWPSCQKCIRLNRQCDYTARPRKKYTRRSRICHPNPVSAANGQGPMLDLATSPTSSHSSRPHDLSSVQIASCLEISTEETLLLPPRQFETRPLHSSPIYAETSFQPPHSILLSEYDHEAIHYVRFVMALRVDTKVPEYSGPALIWTLAAKSPMVLHMVCALGSLKLCYDPSLSLNMQLRKSEAAAHYGTALQLLASAIQNLTQVTDLDFILATLWLMISYEVAHGDGIGADLSVHLRGAALLLQGRLKTLCAMIHQSYPEHARSGGGGPGTRADEKYFGITRLSSQLLLWIAIVDGSAALNGINATFNHLLGESMFDLTQDETSSRLSGFTIIQRYSTMVYRDVWDSHYPQSELIEDLQCSQIFCLQAESGQLRYMLSKLTSIAPYSRNGAEFDFEKFFRTVEDVGLRYRELLTTASSLNLPKDGSQRRYVLNLRMVVPLYHAVVLLLYCVFGASTALNDKQRLALREIITLAYQACADEGNQALCKIAWPLFIVALETDDMLHRDWVLERFEALSKEGENFRRAHKALSFTFSQRRSHQSRITYWQLIGHKEIEPFVLE